ncbi:MAG: nucleotide sugar dehydrogenase [Actinobacteria bacterium]|nr:nucleotide sugar dehydrogenase [Actinomycetota bacterium]
MRDFEESVAYFGTEKWKAGVVGLGYVGLPLAMAILDAGLRCIGFDDSIEVVEGLRSGRSHVDDISDAAVKEALAEGFEVTASPDALGEVDAIFVCVPSPLGRNRQPDMSFIGQAAATLQTAVRPGQLVVLESTSYPGTTEEFFLPAITSNGLELDRDVYLAFSPERVDPGNPRRLQDIPKVVGGVSPESGKVAAAAYSRFMSDVTLVSSARVAEMAKLLENTYRAVNIGLVNEMAQLAHRLGIDIWEVIDAAATKPFGFRAFYPGPGVGGHCIPLDPQFLAWSARAAGFPTRFIDVAEQVNVAMPGYAATRAAEVLNEHGLPLRGTRILGVGLAYKANIADSRESPAVNVLRQLASGGAAIGVLDPVVGEQGIRAHGFVPTGASPEELAGFSLAVILTDHDVLDLEAIADAIPLVFDTRDAYRRRGIVRSNVSTL